MGQRKKINQDDVLKALSDGGSYSVEELRIRLGCGDKTIRDELISLISFELIEREKVGRMYLYRLPKKTAKNSSLEATPKFSPFKPLGILDIATFQRQCEAARNSETGMI